MTAVEVAENHP